MGMGAVYTKPWVVRFVLDVAGYTADEDLVNGVAVEPACGEGAFLVEMVRRLCESARTRGLLDAGRLRDCVRAYDVDAVSVERSRRAVCEVLEDEGLPVASAHELARLWVRQGDFLLLDDVPRASWVVGNPPYVRSSALDRDVRSLYASALSCMTMGTDIYVGFYQRGLELLGTDGRLCFICSDRWLQNRYGRRLRDLVSQAYGLSVHVRLHDVDVFEQPVAAYPAITLIGRGPVSALRFVECRPSFSDDDVGDVMSWLRGDGTPCETGRFRAKVMGSLVRGAPVFLSGSDDSARVDEAMGAHPTLAQAGVRVGIGIATGRDDVYVTSDAGLVETSRLLPLFHMRDWRGGHGDRKRWLVNPWGDDGKLVDLDDWPRLKRYYEANEASLRSRHVARTHPDEWYRTIDRLKLDLLGTPMLLMPDMASKACPVLSDGSRYPHHNCYWLTSEEWDLRALGGLLTSDVIGRYVGAIGVRMRGGTMRFQAQYLRRIHVPRVGDVDCGVMRDLVLAFETGDVELAGEAARAMYGIGTRP